MNLSTWLEAEKGRSALLAAHFGKTPAAISQWKKNGVPLDLMKRVRDFTGGVVTLEEMVPGDTSTQALTSIVAERAEAASWPRDVIDRRQHAERRSDVPGACDRRSGRERREG